MTLKPLERRVIKTIGARHLSTQEIAQVLDVSASAVGRAVMALSRRERQILHVSGADEALATPEGLPWDSEGNERLQLTRHGLDILAGMRSV